MPYFIREEPQEDDVTQKLIADGRKNAYTTVHNVLIQQNSTTVQVCMD